MNNQVDQQFEFILSQLLLKKENFNSNYRKRILFENYHNETNIFKNGNNESIQKKYQNERVNRNQPQDKGDQQLESNYNISTPTEFHGSIKNSLDSMKFYTKKSSKDSRSTKDPYLSLNVVSNNNLKYDYQTENSLKNYKNKEFTSKSSRAARSKTLIQNLRNDIPLNENFSSLFYSKSPIPILKKNSLEPPERLKTCIISNINENFQKSRKLPISRIFSHENFKSTDSNPLNSEKSPNNNHKDNIAEDDDFITREALTKIHSFLNRIGIPLKKSISNPSMHLKKVECSTPISDYKISKNIGAVSRAQTRALTDRIKTKNVISKNNMNNPMFQINTQIRLRKIYDDCEALHENIISTERKCMNDGTKLKRIYHKLDQNLEDITNSNF